MEIVYPTQFISSLRGKHLLLDTNVFRDAVSRSTDFSRFFNNLKQNDITLVTVDFVRLELLKGSVNETKYKEKEKLIAEIVFLDSDLRNRWNRTNYHGCSVGSDANAVWG